MKLLCKKDVVMKPVFFEGKTYETKGKQTSKEIRMTNEQLETHYFSTDPSNPGYFGKWFEVIEE